MGEVSKTVLESISDSVTYQEQFKWMFRNLQIIAHDTALEKGWWNPPTTFGEQLVLFHAEISEALEEFRSGKLPNEIYVSTQLEQPDKPEGIPIEFADLLIRLLDTCEYYDIDLIGAVLEKMEYNKTRSHRHGNKVI